MNLSPSMISNISKQPIYVQPVVEETPIVKSNIPHEDLKEALFFMQDVLERSSIPFMVLGDVGKQIIEMSDPILVANKIELGVLKRHYTESGKSTFWSVLDNLHVIGTDEEDNLAIEYKEVPVYIKIIKKDYPFFEHPNSKFFFVEDLCFPNPYNEYWENKKEIE